MDTSSTDTLSLEPPIFTLSSNSRIWMMSIAIRTLCCGLGNETLPHVGTLQKFLNNANALCRGPMSTLLWIYARFYVKYKISVYIACYKIRVFFRYDSFEFFCQAKEFSWRYLPIAMRRFRSVHSLTANQCKNDRFHYVANADKPSGRRSNKSIEISSVQRPSRSAYSWISCYLQPHKQFMSSTHTSRSNTSSTVSIASPFYGRNCCGKQFNASHIAPSIPWSATYILYYSSYVSFRSRSKESTSLAYMWADIRRRDKGRQALAYTWVD